MLPFPPQGLVDPSDPFPPQDLADRSDLLHPQDLADPSDPFPPQDLADHADRSDRADKRFGNNRGDSLRKEREEYRVRQKCYRNNCGEYDYSFFRSL